MVKKSKKNRTQVCFLLDETQSMQARKQETMQGFNGYVKELQKDKGDEVLFTLTTFNKGGIKTPYKSVPVKDVKPLDNENYNPQNWTPLYDAIGQTLTDFEKTVSKDDLVLFIILTDGEENSSIEFKNKLSDIKDMIQKREKDGWKFTFLGVGIDAFATGGSIGLSASSSFDIGASGLATQNMYATMTSNTSNMRSMYSSKGISATASLSVLTEADRKKLKD